jgi:NADP-dependent 3-hydroxy acid dehydrogenase YdfG
MEPLHRRRQDLRPGRTGGDVRKVRDMPAETRSLSGAVVAITGASAGIGTACARLLVEEGANVALGARRAERLDALVEELGPDRALAVVMDVRSPDDNRRLVGAAVDRWGRLDTMVANAGIGLYGSIMDHGDDHVDEMMATNFAGTVWSVRAAVPALRAAGGGDVVIVSSVAGLRGGGDEAVYAGTKFAQVGLAGALDRELRAEGIRVTAICPAGVHTEFAMGTGREPDSPFLADFLRPEDVAYAVVATLRQPRRVRTTLWSLWSMGQQS